MTTESHIFKVGDIVALTSEHNKSYKTPHHAKVTSVKTDDKGIQQVRINFGRGTTPLTKPAHELVYIPQIRR